MSEVSQTLARCTAEDPSVMPTVESLKLAYIQHVVGVCGGNISRAAAVLDVDRKMVYRWLERAGVDVNKLPRSQREVANG